MPGTKLKPLHMATSLEQLKTHIKLGNLTTYNIINVCKSAGKVYQEAEKCRLEGDEEKSFILYMKYWELIDKMRKSPEFKKDKKYYEGMLGRQNALDALSHMEELQESLVRRYGLLEEEKIQKKQEEEIIANSLQEPKPEIEDVAKTRENGDEDLNFTVKNNDRKGFITSPKLFKLMNNDDKTILIIDVRSKYDFDDSHIQHSSCFNVDDYLITPGLTGKSLENKLLLTDLKYWNERAKVDFIVLYDWTGEDTDSKLSILLKSMTVWDTRVKLKHEPLILYGGFEMWQLHYPMCTSKRMPVSIPKFDSQGESDSNFVDLDYPDFDDNNSRDEEHILSSIANLGVKQPVFDRTTKPSTSVRFPSNLVINNLDQSLMTNGSTNANLPQVNRTLKPKESALLDSNNERSDEMKNMLAKQHKAVNESLFIEKERYEKEQNLKILQLKREKEAEEAMRSILQEQEEKLLEQIQKLELEKRQKEVEEQKMKEENEKSKQVIALMAKQRHVDLKRFEEERDEIQKKYNERLKLERETEKLRQERKNKEKDRIKTNETRKIETSTTSVKSRSESPKLRVDSQTTKPELPTVHQAGDSYYTKLNDHQADKSNQSLQVNKPSLSRSHSSPNIAQMIPSDEEPLSRNHMPHIDRTIKPFTKTERKISTIAQQPEDYNAARMRNLMPVYGNQGRALTGLKNLGNTCFMNSVIQCLANTTSLANYFIQGFYRRDINRKNPLGHGGELAEEFAVVIRALWAGQYRSIAPRDFKNTVSKYQPIFEGNEQQDSQEFLLFLMDGLHEDLNEARIQNKTKNLISNDNENLPDTKAAELAWEVHSQQNRSLIVKLFQGQLKSTVKCLHCNKQSVSFDPLQFLSLPIPTGNASRYNLKDCLQVYLKEENMTGADKWYCPKCKERRDAVKKCDIWKLPPVLLIHLKRFSYDGMWRRKLQTLVDFPLENLDFKTFVKEPKARYTCYSLYAVSNHYGTMEGGHYTAYCKNNEYQKWFKFDDHEVYEIGSEAVKSSAAYILFYRADNLNIPPTNEQ